MTRGETNFSSSGNSQDESYAEEENVKAEEVIVVLFLERGELDDSLDDPLEGALVDPLDEPRGEVLDDAKRLATRS